MADTTISRDAQAKRSFFGRNPRSLKVQATILFLLIATIIPTVILTNQKQDTRQHASGEVIDTLSYLLPADRSKSYGFVSSLLTSDNKLYVKVPDNSSQIFSWDTNFISLLEDTPDYAFAPGYWMQRNMAVGETLAVNGTRTDFDATGTCSIKQSNITYNYTNTILKHMPSYNAGGDLGTVDAIILKNDYGTAYDLYYYAKNYGFFYWEKHKADGTLIVKSTVYNQLIPSSSQVSYFDCSKACSPSLRTCTPAPTPTGTQTQQPTPTTQPTPITTSCPSNTYTATLTPLPSVTSQRTGSATVTVANKQELGYGFSWATSFNPLPGNDFKGVFLGFTGAMSGSGIGIYMDHPYTESQSGGYYMDANMLQAMEAGNMYAILKTNTYPNGELKGSMVCKDTSALTPTSTQASATVNLTMYLHGIGNGGDSVNPKGTGTTDPWTTTRIVTVGAYQGTRLITSAAAPLNYDRTLGAFTGSVMLPVPTSSNLYTLTVKTPGFIRATATSQTTIAVGQTATQPPIYLITGDLNDDNMLDMSDYNAFLTCLDWMDSGTCTDEGYISSDMDDNGIVDLRDYNLFLRELSAQNQ